MGSQHWHSFDARRVHQTNPHAQKANGNPIIQLYHQKLIKMLLDSNLIESNGTVKLTKHE